MSPQTGGGRSSSSHSATGFISYDDARIRFLAKVPRGGKEELEYFTRLGMFIFFRWQAIQDDATATSRPFDDNSVRWDECSLREYANIQADARELIKSEVSRRCLANVAKWLLREKLGKISRNAGWVGMTIWEHFVGAFGLLLFGLLFVLAKPYVAREIREAFNELLPEQTSPYTPTPCIPAKHAKGGANAPPDAKACPPPQ